MQQMLQNNNLGYGFSVGGGHSYKAPPKAQRAVAAFAGSEHSMWKNTQVRTDAQGREEAFSIGPDGFIWSYFRNNDAFAAGRLKSTGLMASSFVLGQTDSGRVVIVAADGVNVCHVMEDGRDGKRWSKPQLVACHGLKQAVNVEKVLMQSIGSTLFVALLIQQVGDRGEECFQLWDAVWAGDAPIFGNSPAKLYGESNIWMDALASGFGDLI